MRRFASICAVVYLVLMMANFSFAAEPRTLAPVQQGFVTDGESVEPFALDRVLVQFTPEAVNRAIFRDAGAKSAGVDAAWTGLASLDPVLNALDVTGLAQMHGNLKNQAEVERLGIDRWYRVEVPYGTDIEAAVAQLVTDPNLESAVPDLRAFPSVTPNDPMFPDNWGHNNTAQLPGGPSHNGPGVGTVGFDTNAKSAWNGTQVFGNPSVVIAILDSGVDTTHPDLLQVTGYDYGDNDSNPDDDSADPGHGTACAGVAAAIADNTVGVTGIAGGCSIMPLKIADSGGSLFFSAITDAIYHAADNGADIASMSFGAATTAYAPTDAALTYAYNAGVTLLAATGNENDTAISYPAVNTNVIAVGAASPCGDRKRSSSDPGEVNPGINTDPNGYTCDDEYWWGSNYGSTSQDSRFAVDVLAPTILPTTDIQGSGGYAGGDYSSFFNGTSCATPYAAGVCGLIKSLNPGWGPAQIRAQLVSTTIDIVNVESGAGWDRYSGYGMVDAAAAVGTPVVLPPTADFVADVTDGCAPMTVNFTDLSTGDVTGWNWIFGDGGSSTSQNPTHVYTNPGTYSVTLIATGPEGNDTHTINSYITVGVATVANFISSPPTGPAPLTVTFIDQSTNSTGRVWHFGDGQTSTAQFPAHTYTNPGTYTVMLIASGDCAPDTLTMVDYVTATAVAPPVAAFSGDPLSGCGPLDVTFTDASTGTITSWAWDFGDGNTSTDQNPSHTYTASGTFDVELTVIGPGGSDTATATAYVSVTEGVNAGFSATPLTGIMPLVVDFIDESTGSPTSWSWDFGDGNGSSDQNPNHTYTAAGTYTVRLIAVGTCGPDTLIQTDLITVDLPPAPVAAFSGDPLSGCGPLDVTFTDGSTGQITSWAWDFGDGNTSTEQSPSHTYTAAGSFDVELTVTGPGGSDILTATAYVSVTPDVTAAFSAIPLTGIMPLSVVFTDESTGSPTSWNWDFGDGNTATAQNPSHTYTAAGTYTVRLIAVGTCGPDTLIQTDLITVDLPPAPVAAFSGDPLSGCGPLDVTFTDGSTGQITSWAWDFGDGNTSTEQSPSHTYTASGTFDVELTVTGPGGSDTLLATAYVSVTPDVNAAFSATPTTGAAPLDVDFTDESTGSPTSWAWDLGDGATSTAQNPSHAYTAAGAYTVRLISTGVCGPDTLIQTNLITVDLPPAPVAAFSADPVSGCGPLDVTFTDGSTGDLASWAWDFGDGNTSTEQNPSHTYTFAGDFDVELTVTGPGGSDVLTEVAYISVTPDVSADFIAIPTTGAAPLTVDFEDLSGGSPNSWSWDFGDGGTDTAQDPSHTYTTAGTYTVRLIAFGTCGPDTLIQTNLITVDLPPAPVAAFSADPVSGCGPLDVTFTDGSSGDITSWAWDFGDGNTSTEQNPSHTYTNAGDFDVELTVSGPGGSDVHTEVAYISVTPDVAADFLATPTTGTAPVTVAFEDLSGGSPNAWFWDFGDGGSDSAQNPNHTYTQAGTYTVRLIAAGTCGPDTLIQTDLIVIDAPPAPVAGFSGDPVNGCGPLEVTFTDESGGDITSWAWDFGDGDTSTDQNPVHTYTFSGDFDVQLTVTGPGGGDFLEKVAYISVSPDVAADFIATPTTGTAPVTVDFEDLSGGSPNTWHWDFGDGGMDTAQNPSHTYTQAGTYTVRLIVAGTCGPDTLNQPDLIVIDAPPAPVAAFSGDPVSGCGPLEVAFTDESSGDITTWSWDFGDGGSSTDPSPTYTFTDAGTFAVSLTVTGPGGSDTMTRTDYVTVFEPVTAAFIQSETTGLAPLAVDFTDQSDGDVTFWRWDFGDASTDTVPNPTHVYTTVDSFTVTLIVGNSCRSDTLVMADAVVITALSGVGEVVRARYQLDQNVPNPFNPMTRISFELPEQTNVRLQVFDVSGRLVRSLINGDSLGAGRQEVVWNGTNDAGRQVSAGVYFYHLSAGGFNETKSMTLVK